MSAERDAGGRAAWRAPVRAFRAAAAALARPAPRAMSLLGEVAAVAQLAAEPPTTNFSPFEALPPGDYAAREETSEGAKGRARAPGHADAARNVLDAQPSRAASVRREPTPRAHETSQGTDAFPAFSLRPPRLRDARATGADASARGRRQSSFAGPPASMPRTPRADGLAAGSIVVSPREAAATVPPPHASEASASDGAIPALPRVPRPRHARAEGAGEWRAEQQHAQHPAAVLLLNRLADETLRALKLREGGPRRAASTPAAVPQERDRRRPDDLQPPSPATPRRAEGFTTTPPRAAARVSEATASPRALAPARAPLKPDGERPSGIAGNSIEAITALAELLSARPPAPDSEQFAAPAGGGAPPVEVSFTSHAYANAAKHAADAEVSAPRATPSPGLSAEGETGQPASLDAESVASLVNDVLVEQARRHGVDLS